MNNKAFNSMKPDLIALGFAYYGSPSPLPPDPEKTIIQIIKLFSEDQKIYRIMLAWFERFGDLIHVERIASQINQLSDFEKIILGVTALKMVNAGDSRFKSIVSKIKHKKIKLNIEISGQDEFLIEKHGLDKEFNFFSIKTSKILPADSKKLIDRDFIIKNNLWLRLRLLLGTNFRADIAFVRLNHLAQNAYGAMKLLNCSKETSYRIWNSLAEAGVESIISFKPIT